MKTAVPELKEVVQYDLRSVWLTENSNKVDVCHLLDVAECKDEETYRIITEIYRGPLLDSLEFPHTQLDELLPVLRAQVESHFFHLVEETLQSLTHYGFAELPLLREIESDALRIDPDREETYKALMRAYGAVGSDQDIQRLADILSPLTEPNPLNYEAKKTASIRPRYVEPSEIDPSRGNRTQLIRPRVALLAPRHLPGATLSKSLAKTFIEDLANEMSKDNRFATLAAHSTFKTNHDGGILTENSLLRADYTVFCSLHPGSDLGEISLRLVDTKTETIIWADRFNLAPTTLFSIGRHIVTRVAIDLTSAIEQSLLTQFRQEDDNPAYLDFLKGQRALRNCDLKSVRRARRHFLNVIRSSERHSESYAGVSYSLYLEWLLMGGTEPRLLAEARDLADSAINGNPSSPSGYWRKAMVTLYQHDFETSEECFEKAHVLSPSSADILLDHSDALGFVGDPTVAWAMFQQAIDLNPTPPAHYWWAGASIAFSQGKYEHAIELCNRVENEESVLRLLASCHGQLGNTLEAREFGQRLTETYPGQTAEEMTRLQPHRKPEDLEPFIHGLKLAGVM